MAYHPTLEHQLALFAYGKLDRHDLQDDNNMSWDQVIGELRRYGLTLPIVRTYGRFNDTQKALYHEVFSP